MTPTTIDHAGLDQRPDLLHSLAYQIDKSNIIDLLLNTSIETRKEDYIDIMGRSVSLGSAVWSKMMCCSTSLCPHLMRRARHISFQDRSRTIRLTYVLHHPLTTRSPPAHAVPRSWPRCWNLLATAPPLREGGRLCSSWSAASLPCGS